MGRTEQGETDEAGSVTVPDVFVSERHNAYIVGFPDGTFGPEKYMTRSEAAAIFARILSGKNGDTITSGAKTKFKDVPADAWYGGYVRYLSGFGIVTGTAEDTFSPNKAITRAEVVTLVNRLLGRAADQEFIDANTRRMNSFPDISKGHWAYYDVMEAANTHTATVKERTANS